MGVSILTHGIILGNTVAHYIRTVRVEDGLMCSIFTLMMKRDYTRCF